MAAPAGNTPHRRTGPVHRPSQSIPPTNTAKLHGATGGIIVVLQTVIFRDESGNPLDGIAPSPASQLGRAFDPEGFVDALLPAPPAA